MKTTKVKRQSGSSRPAVRQRGSVKSTTANFIRVTTDDELERDPKVKARIKRELARLAKAGPIDLSDAPELPAPAWEKPIRGMDAWLKTVRASRLYRPMKQAISMRLDADVVSWLKQAGPGYQTRANQILREKMLTDPGR